MKCTYTTLHGEKLNLRKLNKSQKELLRRFYELYRASHEYVGFFNAMNSSYNLKIMGAPGINGQYWINAKVLKSVIYRILQDFSNRLAQRQFHCKQYPDRHTAFTENEKALEKFLSR